MTKVMGIRTNDFMKKQTKRFIGTIAGALVGNAITNLNPVVETIEGATTPLIANLVPFVGLIIGGLIGYYVAKNS